MSHSVDNSLELVDKQIVPLFPRCCMTTRVTFQHVTRPFSHTNFINKTRFIKFLRFCWSGRWYKKSQGTIASVSISNSSCNVTVELALVIAPSPAFWPWGVKRSGTDISKSSAGYLHKQPSYLGKVSQFPFKILGSVPKLLPVMDVTNYRQQFLATEVVLMSPRTIVEHLMSHHRRVLIQHFLSFQNDLVVLQKRVNENRQPMWSSILPLFA